MEKHPPKYALKFLRWFCREDYLEEIEGDLVELFEKKDEGSSRKAKVRFVFDVLCAFRLRNIKAMPLHNQPGLFRHHLTIGWRNLIRNKTYSLINVTGLTLGITCCLVLFIFVRYESTFDSGHLRSTQTYRVVQHTKLPDQTVYWNTTAYPLAEALRNDFVDFEHVTQTAGPMNRFFTVENEQDGEVRFEDDHVLFADAWYPQVFTLGWIAGDPATALGQANSVVLTEDILKKCFQGTLSNPTEALGRIILLNGKDPLTVTGVIKNPPGNISLRYHMIVSYEFFRQHNTYFAGNWSGNYQGTTFVVLNEGKDEKAIETRIANWKKKYLKPEDDARISYFLQPLAAMHTDVLYGSSPGSYQMPDSMLRAGLFVALFILGIAIVNFINLMTARSVARSREVGIRKTIGSTRYHLIQQFTLENALLVVAALPIAIGLTHIVLGNVNSFLSMIDLQLQLEAGDFLLIILVGVATVLLATIYPSLVLSSFRPLQIIQKKRMQGPGGYALRKVLIVFQFAIVQLFVIAAVIVAVQMYYFRNTELGFSSEAVVIIPVPEFDKLNAFRNSLLQSAHVHNVSFGSGPPMAVDGFLLGTTFRLPHQSKVEGKEAEMKIGDLHYLDFYDLKLISGRNFSTNKQSFDEFIINEKLAEAMGWKPEEAIGQKLLINEGEATIVGVVEDYHNNSLQRDITPCVILNWTYFQDRAFIRLNGVNQQALTFIEKIWKETFATSVYRYEFLDRSIEKEYQLEMLVFGGFKIFSILVIAIACLGLIGLMSFMTLRKTKEVGIRKVLGATIFQIVTLFSKEFIVLISLAFMIAVPIAYYFMERWLQGFIYRIELSGWMFLCGGILTLIIAVLTCSFQSVKAAMTDPVESLRME